MPRAARSEGGSQLFLDGPQADDLRVRGAGRRGAPLVLWSRWPELRSRLDSRGIHGRKDSIDASGARSDATPLCLWERASACLLGSAILSWMDSMGPMVGVQVLRPILAQLA